MAKKKPCAKKSCGKSCKKKTCNLKQDKSNINNSQEELSNTKPQIQTPSSLGIFWFYLKKRLGL